MQYRAFLIALVLFFTPTTAFASSWSPDLNCDGTIDVVDVMLSILQALGTPLSEVLDSNGDDVPDACESLACEGMA